MADYGKVLDELRVKKVGLVKTADELVKSGKLEELKAQNEKIKDISDQIAAVENVAALSQERAEPTDPKDVTEPGGKPKDAAKVTPFRSLGEQLMAIRNVKLGIMDKRLTEVNNAVLGANEGVGADGGFALQEDFAGAILESCVQESELLPLLDSYTMSAAANAMRWLMVSETDVSASVFGGVQMYWAAEGATVGTSKPKFKEMKMDMEKMMGFAYATEEILSDAPFMTGFFGTAFSLASDRLITGGCISGDGVGKPLGYLNSPALITVDKATGQAAGTLTGENIIKMQARALPKSRQNLVWLMHPDLEEQLPYLVITQGDATKFLWNPEGGLGNFDSQRVLNKRVIFDDNCSAIGDKGDISLIDPKQYLFLKKGTVRQDWSMHVEFLTDQMCFRVIFRCNGAPKVDAPVQIKNSTVKRSPFVALAARK
ncbi:MAG TPA: phage major capsid protein [Pseudoflavonifractor sp.]|nr:phage major capsid protein [Pseudoflavonifractor sp.]